MITFWSPIILCIEHIDFDMIRILKSFLKKREPYIKLNLARYNKIVSSLNKSLYLSPKVRSIIALLVIALSY